MDSNWVALELFEVGDNDVGTVVLVSSWRRGASAGVLNDKGSIEDGGASDETSGN